MPSSFFIEISLFIILYMSTELKTKLDRASAGLSKTTSELVAAVEKIVTKDVVLLQDLEEKISIAEDNLKNLEGDYDIKLRNAKVDFDTSLREHKMDAVVDFIGSDKSIVDNSELEELKTKLAGVPKEIDQAVAIQKSKDERKAANDLKIQELEHQKEQSSNLATIESLKKEIIFLNKQITTYEQQISDERTASVDRAKAAQPIINQVSEKK